MQISEIIAKVLAGQELSADEQTFLENYREPEAADRIPKSRLDQEIAKKKELEQRLEDVTRQLEEYENRDLSDVERNRKVIDNLKKRIDSLTQERDQVQAAKAELEFRGQVTKTAGAFNFDDSEYLEYLVRRDNIDLSDEEGVLAFMSGLKESCPKHFNVNINSGGAGSVSTGDSGEFESARCQGDIDLMIANAPSISL